MAFLFLGKYEEFAPGMGFDSVEDHIHDKPYDTKQAILRYLKSGKVHMVTAARIVDIFTGKRTNHQLVHMNDGEYSWNSKLIYYIDEYNLRLPKEIEDNILMKAS